MRSEEEYERVRLRLLQIYTQKIQALQVQSVGRTGIATWHEWMGG